MKKVVRFPGNHGQPRTRGVAKLFQPAKADQTVNLTLHIKAGLLKIPEDIGVVKRRERGLPGSSG